MQVDRSDRSILTHVQLVMQSDPGSQSEVMKLHAGDPQPQLSELARQLIGAFSSGKCDCKRRALAVFAFESDRPTLCFNEGLRDRQSQPGASCWSLAVIAQSDELIEDSGLVFGSNAFASITHADLYLIANQLAGNTDTPTFWCVADSIRK